MPTYFGAPILQNMPPGEQQRTRSQSEVNRDARRAMDSQAARRAKSTESARVRQGGVRKKTKEKEPKRKMKKGGGGTGI